MSVPFEQTDDIVDLPPTSDVIPGQRIIPVGSGSGEITDRAFIEGMRACGLLGELNAEQLSRQMIRSASHERVRQLDLLELYYQAGGDIDARLRRLRADGFVVHHADGGENAHAVVRRIATVEPALGRPSLERIGTSDGPLVLRSGDHVCAVDDEEDSDESPDSFVGPTVRVRGLVRAANVLLERLGTSRRRWVLLRCDGRREAYCAVDADGALELCSLGWLEERSASRLLEFCAY